MSTIVRTQVSATVYAVAYLNSDGQVEDVYFEDHGSASPDQDPKIERAKILKKARKLLRRHLTPAQLEDYDANNAFNVTGGQTRHKYRIYPWYGENILRYPTLRNPGCKLCFLPEYRLPSPDMMLMQKLSLELREEEALEASNFWKQSRRDFRDMQARFRHRAMERHIFEKAIGYC